MSSVAHGIRPARPEEIKKWTEGMTFLEFAQAIIPGISDQEADFILWNMTAFPFNDIYSLRRQLEDVAKEANGEIYS